MHSLLKQNTVAVCFAPFSFFALPDNKILRNLLAARPPVQLWDQESEESHVASLLCFCFAVD